MSPATDTIHDHLSDIYREYRQTKDIPSKAIFFSPQCHQICRTNSSYAATDRETIVKYLLEVGPVIEDIYRREGWLDGQNRGPPRSFYAVRPLSETEMSDFATIEELEPAGYKSVEEVQKKARDENWEGLRVDMWTDDGDKRGILVKVQYWWRMEPLGSKAGTWKQILHDILYLGPRDGSEQDITGEIIEEK